MAVGEEGRMMVSRRTWYRPPPRVQPRMMLSLSLQRPEMLQNLQLLLVLVLLQLLIVSASSTDCMLSSDPFLRGFGGHRSRQDRHPSRARDASDFDDFIKRTKHVEFGGARRQQPETTAVTVAAADLAMITCTPCMGGAPAFFSALAARGEIMGGRTGIVCGRAELRRRERGPRSFVGASMEVAGTSRLGGCTTRLSSAPTPGSMEEVAGTKKLAGNTRLSAAPTSPTSGDFHPGDDDGIGVARAGVGFDGGGGSGAGDGGGDAQGNAGVSMDVGNLGDVGNYGKVGEGRVERAEAGEGEVISPLKAYLISEIGVPPTRLDALMRPAPFPCLRDDSHALDSAKLLTAFLVQEARVPKAKLSQVLISCPQLLYLRLPLLSERLEFLTQVVGIPHKKIGALVTRFPSILKYSISNLDSSLSFLIKDVGVRPGTIASIVGSHPGILQLSVENNLIPSFRAFVSEAGLTRKQAALAVERFPGLLALSYENNISPKISWLRNTGLSHKDVAHVITSRPSFFSSSTVKLDNLLDFLTQEIGVPPAKISSVLRSCPDLLTYTVPRLTENLKFLTGGGRSTDSPFPREDDIEKAMSIARLEEGLEVLEGGGCKGLGMTGDQARQVILSFPRLLTYKIDDNLAKKVDFLLQRGYMINDVKREVVKSPLVLAYSLECRIRPRAEHLVKCGVSLTVGGATSGSQSDKTGRVGAGTDNAEERRITLKSMLSPPDSVFFNRYVLGATVHWIAYGSTMYDPYGTTEDDSDLYNDDEDSFEIDLSGLH